MIDYISWICMVIWFLWTEIGMLGMKLFMDLLVGGVLVWGWDAWGGMWILLVQEFQGKLLVMVVSVYLDIGDV